MFGKHQPAEIRGRPTLLCSDDFGELGHRDGGWGWCQVDWQPSDVHARVFQATFTWTGEQSHVRFVFTARFFRWTSCDWFMVVGLQAHGIIPRRIIICLRPPIFPSASNVHSSLSPYDPVSSSSSPSRSDACWPAMCSPCLALSQEPYIGLLAPIVKRLSANDPR